MIKKLLLGTNNSHKVSQMKQFFSGLDIEIVTPKDVGIVEEPEETGETLEENAKLKADFYFAASGIPCVSDDAGMQIPALNNFPGVHSKRFAGYEMSDDQIIEGILEKMKGLEGEDRKAEFRLSVVLKLSDSEVYTASGSIAGVVPPESYEKRHHHAPYRSLLFVTELNKWFMDVTEEEENQIGYRKAAVEKLKEYLI